MAKLIQSLLRLPKRRYPYWQINHDLRVILIHNPKAAGTSIMRGLGMVHCQEEEILIDQGHPPQSRLRETHKEWWKNYLKVAWVRDPMTRAISAYHFSKDWTPPLGAAGGRAVDCDLLRERSFEDCLRLMLDWPDALQQPMWKPQSYFISEPGEFDFIGRYESLEQDWGKLCDLVGYDLFLPNLNPSSPRHEPDFYYTPFTCAAIEHFYGKDYAAFRYTYPVPHSIPADAVMPPQDQLVSLPKPNQPIPPSKPCGDCGKVPQPPLELVSVAGDLTSMFQGFAQ